MPTTRSLGQLPLLGPRSGLALRSPRVDPNDVPSNIKLAVRQAPGTG